ncbi:unnamed protein product [Euphydryas editha]|uniref:Uncharacterized protein n=1 Tax=Euphydryas editha TaxID=104508 RepID=A0AAU9UTK1_EUPED|nr:unnamed protein product [Euphydryas editha]
MLGCLISRKARKNLGKESLIKTPKTVRVRKLDSENKNPRAVIVKLRSVLLRDTILISGMKFNRLHPKENLSTQHLGYGHSVRPIFMSEHLSPLNKKIHAAPRKAAREKCYLYLWVRGLKSKLSAFRQAAQLGNYDVKIGTETWLDDGINDGEIFDSGYRVYRHDRASTILGNKKGGGVLIAVSMAIISDRITKWESDIEDLWVRLKKVATIRDLGVQLDRKLSFVNHFDIIVAKALKMVGFVKRACSEF